MGLAPYGNPESEQVSKFIAIIKNSLIDIKEDGSIWLNQKYFTYATGLRMVPDKKWEQLFGFPRRMPESKLQQQHCDLALAIQQVTEEIVLKLALEAKKLTGLDHLCMAGGVALNCVANGKLIQEGIFKEVFFQPAAGDAGGALGAAWAAHYLYFKEPRLALQKSMLNAYLGPAFSNEEIQDLSDKEKAVYIKFEEEEALIQKVAEKISQGAIIGWFQGRMEYGPRALGNRSILADPSRVDMQKKLNLSIKYRESFRPFAPSVLEAEASKYFDLDIPSPYMMLTAKVRKTLQTALIGNYRQFSLQEKLEFERSLFPAITHVDFSARIQTVNQNQNPLFYRLLLSVKNLMGSGMLINTSFNVRGEPIVCTPADAYRCFMHTEMDFLVMGPFFFDKKEQSDAKKPEKPGPIYMPD